MKSRFTANILALSTAVAFATISSTSVVRAEAAEAASGSEKISLLDAAPPVLSVALRYPKYYSDPNTDRATVDGPLAQRQYLFGSFGGARDRLAANGFLFSGGITQTVQGVVDGAGDDGKTRFAGSADFYLGIDTGRAGWWSGGLIIAHAEGNWDVPVSGAGALLPLNADTIMPGEPSSFALSELYLFQALPNDFSLIAGKFAATAFADTTLFANNERNQFLYEGLVNNAVLGAFVPYTSWGALVSKQINPTFSVAGAVLGNTGNALSLGLDDLDADEVTIGAVFDWSPTFYGKPGNYNVLLGYSNKDVASFDVDPRYLLGEVLGEVPVIEEDDNYAMTIAGSQYFWTNPTARRSDGKTVGYGPFFRVGLAPSDRNLIDEFYSIGLGGNGGILGRHDDNWGVGVSYTGFSNDLRDNLDDLNVDVDSNETVAEAFYNVAWTPAIKTSFHVQYVESANPTLDEATILGLRLQLDF